MIYVIIISSILIVFFTILSWYIASSIFHPKTWDYDKSYLHEQEKGFIDDNYLSNFIIEEIFVQNNGIQLHAQLINNHSKNTIILMHGHTFSLYGGYKYLKIFLDLKFNVLMPNQRFHGKSEGKSTTLGYKEKIDLDIWTKHIKEIIPETTSIGYHGESMGAATVLLNGHSQDIKYIISDCSFATLKRQTQDLLWKNYKIPPFMVYGAHVFGSLFYGVPLLKVNPVNNIKNISVPILFIHGDKDSYIGIDHVYTLHKKAKDSRLYLCEGADHAESLEKNYQVYYDTVHHFLKEKELL